MARLSVRESVPWAASGAARNSDRASSFMELFIAQADDGILFRGPLGRDDAEHDAHGARHAESDEHRGGRDDGAHRGEALDRVAESDAEQDAGSAAGDADDHGLGEELVENVL